MQSARTGPLRVRTQMIPVVICSHRGQGRELPHLVNQCGPGSSEWVLLRVGATGDDRRRLHCRGQPNEKRGDCNARSQKSSLYEVRQSRNVRRDPTRLVFGKQFCRSEYCEYKQRFIRYGLRTRRFAFGKIHRVTTYRGNPPRLVFGEQFQV
jgi:hypothetical protein